MNLIFKDPVLDTDGTVDSVTFAGDVFSSSPGSGLESTVFQPDVWSVGSILMPVSFSRSQISGAGPVASGGDNGDDSSGVSGDSGSDTDPTGGFGADDGSSNETGNNNDYSDGADEGSDTPETDESDTSGSPSGGPDSSSSADSGPPQDDNISGPSGSDSGSRPPHEPGTSAGPYDEYDDGDDTALSGGGVGSEAESRDTGMEVLTARTDRFTDGLYSGISRWFRDVVQDLRDFGASLRNPTGQDDHFTVTDVPVAWKEDGAEDGDPLAGEGAGLPDYPSQRDLEQALGRKDWTFCCATSFVYATQVYNPGLDETSLIDAVGTASDTPLSDGSGNCVAEDGDCGQCLSVYPGSVPGTGTEAVSRRLGHLLLG